MTPVRRLFGGLGNSMFQYAYIINQLNKGEIPDIYLQDEKYFVESKEYIRNLFSEGIENIDQVSIHVRRAENPTVPNEPKYCENPFYVNLSETTYYEDAMAQFPEAEFLVFSDDIEWCKKQEMFKDCEFSEGRTELEDMNLMASCSGHIIANSSYSWWAAYISGKKTVAPKDWFSDGIERTKIPKEWIIL